MEDDVISGMEIDEQKCIFCKIPLRESKACPNRNCRYDVGIWKLAKNLNDLPLLLRIFQGGKLTNSGLDDVARDMVPCDIAKVVAGERSELLSNVYVMWPNRESLCWLNASLSLLFNSNSLVEILNIRECSLAYAYKEYQAVLRDCQRDSTEESLFQLMYRLQVCQQNIFDKLETGMGIRRGNPDSPVFAIPVLLKEDKKVLELFEFRHKWSIKCHKCTVKNTPYATKSIISFQEVPTDFTMEEPTTITTCKRCNANDQKRCLILENLPVNIILHFQYGLPHRNFEAYDFQVQGQTYHVKGYIQYTKVNGIPHFTTAVRDVKSGYWLDCNDLGERTRMYSPQVPDISPSEIHFVMWERDFNDKESVVSVESKVEEAMEIDPAEPSPAPIKPEKASPRENPVRVSDRLKNKMAALKRKAVAEDKEEEEEEEEEEEKPDDSQIDGKGPQVAQASVDSSSCLMPPVESGMPPTSPSGSSSKGQAPFLLTGKVISKPYAPASKIVKGSPLKSFKIIKSSVSTNKEENLPPKKPSCPPVTAFKVISAGAKIVPGKPIQIITVNPRNGNLMRIQSANSTNSHSTVPEVTKIQLSSETTPDSKKDVPSASKSSVSVQPVSKDAKVESVGSSKVHPPIELPDFHKTVQALPSGDNLKLNSPPPAEACESLEVIQKFIEQMKKDNSSPYKKISEANSTVLPPPPTPPSSSSQSGSNLVFIPLHPGIVHLSTSHKMAASKSSPNLENMSLRTYAGRASTIPPGNQISGNTDVQRSPVKPKMESSRFQVVERTPEVKPLLQADDPSRKLIEAGGVQASNKGSTIPTNLTNASPNLQRIVEKITADAEARETQKRSALKKSLSTPTKSQSNESSSAKTLAASEKQSANGKTGKDVSTPASSSGKGTTGQNQRSPTIMIHNEDEEEDFTLKVNGLSNFEKAFGADKVVVKPEKKIEANGKANASDAVGPSVAPLSGKRVRKRTQKVVEYEEVEESVLQELQKRPRKPKRQRTGQSPEKAPDKTEVPKTEIPFPYVDEEHATLMNSPRTYVRKKAKCISADAVEPKQNISSDSSFEDHKDILSPPVPVKQPMNTEVPSSYPETFETYSKPTVAQAAVKDISPQNMPSPLSSVTFVVDSKSTKTSSTSIPGGSSFKRDGSRSKSQSVATNRNASNNSDMSEENSGGDLWEDSGQCDERNGTSYCRSVASSQETSCDGATGKETKALLVHLEHFLTRYLDSATLQSMATQPGCVLSIKSRSKDYMLELVNLPPDHPTTGQPRRAISIKPRSSGVTFDSIQVRELLQWSVEKKDIPGNINVKVVINNADFLLKKLGGGGSSSVSSDFIFRPLADSKTDALQSTGPAKPTKSLATLQGSAGLRKMSDVSVKIEKLSDTYIAKLQSALPDKGGRNKSQEKLENELDASAEGTVTLGAEETVFDESVPAEDESDVFVPKRSPSSSEPTLEEMKRTVSSIKTRTLRGVKAVESTKSTAKKSPKAKCLKVRPPPRSARTTSSRKTVKRRRRSSAPIRPQNRKLLEALDDLRALSNGTSAGEPPEEAKLESSNPVEEETTTHEDRAEKLEKSSESNSRNGPPGSKFEDYMLPSDENELLDLFKGGRSSHKY